MTEGDVIVMFEKLDRIIALLEKAEDDRAICPHGNSGVCMYCVIQHDLLRAKEPGR